MSTGREQMAKDISNALLEGTRVSLLERDFETFFPHFVLPHVITTFDVARQMTTREDCEVLFHSICDEFEANGVTDIVRTCISASFHDETTIHATHESHQMRRGHRIKDPYPCLSVIIRVGDEWKVSSSHYATESKSFHAGLPPKTRQDGAQDRPSSPNSGDDT